MGLRVFLAAFGITAALGLSPAIAAAGVITPNLFADEDSEPMAGAGCSLREAISAANTDGSYGGCNIGSDDNSDTIELPVGTTFSLSLNAADDTNASGDLDVFDEDLIIVTVGITTPGVGRATIDGISVTNDRVLDVGSKNATALDVTLNHVVLEHGHGEPGGNVRNGDTAASTLHLLDSIVRDSHNVGTTTGGGIENAAGALSLTNTTVSGNNAMSSGGGIDLSAGTVTLTRSTVSGNAAEDGGGINNSSGGGLGIANSTISGNEVDDDGGGILGVAQLRNATVTDNTADADMTDGFVNVDGGGGVGGPTVLADNSIIAGNIDASPGLSVKAPDCEGTLSGSFDLIGATSPACTNSTVNSLTGTPVLSRLGFFGGLTRTHALFPGSPAINAGNPATPDDLGTNCFTTDQRGLPRSGSAGRCDIGAYELQDTDGDGVFDTSDACGTQAGPASNGGCPLPPATAVTAAAPTATAPKKCKKGRKLKRGKCVKKKKK